MVPMNGSSSVVSPKNVIDPRMLTCGPDCSTVKLIEPVTAMESEPSENDIVKLPV